MAAVLDAGAAVERLLGPVPGELGPMTGSAAMVVAIGDDPPSDELMGRRHQHPVVVVGTAGRPRPGAGAALDVLLCGRDGPVPPAPWVGVDDPAATARLLADAADASPEAAVTLAQLLRAGERLDGADALVAESLAYSTLQSGPTFRAWLRDRPRRDPHPGGDEAVLVERRGDDLEVVLNRPAARNAVDRAVRDGLVAALATAAADDRLTVHLRGAGPCFSAGGDLSEFGTLPDPATAHLVRTTRSAAALLHRLRDRCVAHLHGSCVGAGIELPAFCGTVRADPATTVRLPEVRFGLVPGAGGTVSLPRRIGRHRTAFLALGADPLDAPTALRWGLFDALDPN